MFSELDPKNHQEKSVHHLCRGFFQVLWTLWSTFICDYNISLMTVMMPHKMIMFSHGCIILSPLSVMARFASVGVRETPMPLWLSATISARRWSTTGTAPSTPLSTQPMPLESCSLQEPARGIATWVLFCQPDKCFLNGSLNALFLLSWSLWSNLQCYARVLKTNASKGDPNNDSNAVIVSTSAFPDL